MAIIPLPELSLHRVIATPMVAAEKLKVDIAGVKALEITVPTGKLWTVRVKVNVEETDA